MTSSLPRGSVSLGRGCPSSASGRCWSWSGHSCNALHQHLGGWGDVLWYRHGRGCDEHHHEAAPAAEAAAGVVRKWIYTAVVLSVVLRTLSGCGSYQPVLVDTRKPALDGTITT